MSFDRSIDEVHPVRFVCQIRDTEQLFDLVIAFLGQRRGMVFFVDDVVNAVAVFARALQSSHRFIRALIFLYGLLRSAADDMRSSRFIHENAVDFVDNREVQLAHNQLGFVEHHVVAQVIETKLMVRSVNDVLLVSFTPAARRKVYVTRVFVRCTRRVAIASA